MRRRKGLSMLLVTSMLAAMLPTGWAYGAEAKPARGMEEAHWGFSDMKAWVDQGLMTGYPDGSLRPDAPVTRAQFAKLLGGVFRYGASAEAGFTDVTGEEWFAADIAKAAAAGIIAGYPDGSFKPDDPVSRQDAAKIAAAAFKLPLPSGAEAEETLLAYADGEDVGDYAAAAFAKLTDDGVLKGYPDGTSRPGRSVTRAEAVAMLGALSGEVVQKAGIYEDRVTDGHIVVNAEGITLAGAKVEGNVYLTAGIGDGDVTISGADIEGVLHVGGGGANSVHIEDSNVGMVVVDRLEGPVRVVLEGDTEVEEMSVENEAVIEVEEGASVGRLAFQPGAEGSKLQSKGKIGELKGDEGIEVIKPTPSPSPAVGGPVSTPSPSPTVSPSPTDLPRDEGWKLVWNDEFDGEGENLDDNGVNLDKWDYQLGTGSQYGLDGWGNNEEQYYRAENIAVAGGLLTITAKEETHQGKPYTSGRLFTEPTFTQTYGKFEARMKLPAGEGLWPAFWMMPEDSEYGAWAASGEIDIMEARGRLPKEVGGTIHFGRNWPNNKSTGDEYHFEGNDDITGFHVYGLEWEPGELRWYVDGELYQTVNNWDSWGAGQPAKYAYPAPFDKPFYMILNLAVGGNYDGGRKPPSDLMPAQMQVDYVRVYELDGQPYRTPAEPAVEAEPYPSDYKEPVDGNFVYDANYEEGFTDVSAAGQALDPEYWNFVHVDTFAGAGSASVETLDGERFAKASITSGGNAAHAVQLIQNVTLGKGRWYKLSFDAKSDANRTMTVKLGGGESRGWSVYSDSLEARLAGTVQSYAMTFQMTNDTDTLARLEFNMGLSTAPVWIGNVRLEETTAPDPYSENAVKEPLDNGNHIYNGSFDLGRMDRMTYWQLIETGAAAADASVGPEARELEVQVTAPGANAEDIVLVQKGLTLIDGNEYKLTFSAKAEQSRMIAAGLRKPNGSAYGASKSVTLGTEMEEHELTFWIEGGQGASSQLAFLLGGVAGDVYLDDIVLTRLTDNNVGDLPLADQFPLQNGDFSNGMTEWSEHVQGRYDNWDQVTRFAVQDEAMVGTISSVGNNAWDVMLMQTDFALKKGQTYTVTLDAKSSVPRETEIVIDIPNNRLLSEREALTTGWQTFSYELPVNADVTASFKLLLGKLENAAELGAHTVTVDNVRVEVKDARATAFLAENGYFDDGMSGWSTHVQGDHDDTPSSASFAAAGGGAKASVEHPGVNPWDVVLFQDAVELKKGNTYTVSFAARATTPRSIDLSVENGTFFRYLDKRIQVEDYTRSYSFEFKMMNDDTAALKFLLGKMPEEGTSAHDIFIDNVRFELKGAREATGEKARSGHDIGLAAPPAVSPDASGNILGQPLELTFAPNAGWQSAITKVYVGEALLDAGAYEASSGKLTIDSSVFAAAGTYDIVIRATGFEPAYVTQEVLSESEWTLVWNDEFDGSGDNLDANGVDLDKWAYQQGTGSEFGLDSWGNNELQYYTKDNIAVDDGKLRIEAKNESMGGKSYTSGRLWTSPTFAKAYGKFEARMKLPEGTGLWPAFWLMPKDSEYGGWASSGEIDIMEARGRLPLEVDGTIHFGKNAPNNKATGSKYQFPEGQDFTGYHTYSLEWEPGELRWYVDGQLFQTLNDWHSWGAGQPDKYAYPAPFDKPFYIIMNLAVGGNYDGGRTPEAGAIPATMEVDYVRVYELTGREYKEPVEPALVKEEFPANGKEPVNGNLIYDVSFEEGINDVTTADPEMDLTYWNFLHDNEFGGSGAATVETVDGTDMARFELEAGGNANYALQLIQYLTLTKGHYYKLSFDAKAETKRNMSVKFGGDASSNWAIYSDNFDVGLKESVGHYEYRFQMTGDTNPLARLEFNMGQNTSDVWIGNVRVETVDMLSSPDDPKTPLAGGNHIYNGTFDLGAMDRMKYWGVTESGAGAADASVDPGDRWLAVDVTNGGAGASDVMLTQKGVQLLQSDSYRLSFDARSADGMPVEVRLASKNGATIYAGPFEAELDGERERYTFTFEMPTGVTDAESQLQFLFGGHSGDVQLDNVELIRTSNRNVDYSGVDLYPLRNGDFHFALNGWEPFTQGGNAVFGSENGAAKVHVTNVGSAGWNVMLNQSNLQLTGGLTYELSFDVSSSVARDIEVSIENGAYTRRFFSGSLAVSPETKRYSFTFGMPIDELTALKFMIGKTAQSTAVAHDIIIDNVELNVQYPPVLRPPTMMTDDEDNRVGEDVTLKHSGSDDWVAAVTSVSVNGNALEEGAYEMTGEAVVIDAAAFAEEGSYVIKVQAAGYADVTVRQLMLAGDGNLVLNGGMNQGLASWERWEGEGGDSTVTVENGAAKAVIHWHGGLHPEWNIPIGWSTQFFQSGIQLEGGKTYELSFNAWSTADRPVAVELGGYNNNQSVLFNLTGDSAGVHKTVLRPGGQVPLVLRFLLGNVVNGELKTPDAEHTIYIDNVMVREVFTPPALSADDSGNKVGEAITVTFPDSAVWRSAVQAVKVNGVTASEEMYAWSEGALTLSAGLFPVKGTYEIAIEAAGYGISEVSQQVKTAADNVAQGRVAAASSGTAGLAFDGNGGTRWESNFSDPQWLSVDLGGVYTLEEVILNWEGAYGKSFKLQISTEEVPGESDWTDVFAEANGNGGLDTIVLGGQEARHVRIVGTVRGTPYGYSLWEFEIYGTQVEGGSESDQGAESGSSFESDHEL
ncbi:carbohydrate binding domain-containing protein [Paenibacillus soyae]|uniref:Carbohydrate binding domain-containing protein n=1 Tax=Paenibacillus soyae TaxID=2969249 RepID=A0A9X2MLS8_9BACL|nr:carbohydrate binding domain-containing protein [Paenibacillus soyae]MCR2802585.1 carbohydrate binding domain-containing protein [Paenibacillus soyae]